MYSVIYTEVHNKGEQSIKNNLFVFRFHNLDIHVLIVMLYTCIKGWIQTLRSFFLSIVKEMGH